MEEITPLLPTQPHGYPSEVVCYCTADIAALLKSGLISGSIFAFATSGVKIGEFRQLQPPALKYSGDQRCFKVEDS